MSSGGIVLLVIGVAIAAIAGVILYVTDSWTTNALNQTPAVQNLQPTQQSTLHTLEANGGSAISTDQGTLIDSVATVLVALGLFAGYILLKRR